MFAVVITAKGIMMMKFRYYQSIPSLNFFPIQFNFFILKPHFTLVPFVSMIPFLF